MNRYGQNITWSTPGAPHAFSGTCTNWSYRDHFQRQLDENESGDQHVLIQHSRKAEIRFDARVTDAIITAIITTSIELMLWKMNHVDAGVEKLEDLPGDTIAGEKMIVHLWRRAVYSFVAAELAENSRDISATKDGSDRAEEKALTADDHRRNGLHAIRDMLGVGRTTVELI